MNNPFRCVYILYFSFHGARHQGICPRQNIKLISIIFYELLVKRYTLS